jgi:hypothetical protein
MGALHAPVTGKPGSISDPAKVAEPLMFRGFSAFWAETILDTHSE